MNELTLHGFEHEVRGKLHYHHGFGHSQLQRVNGIYNDTLTQLRIPGALHASRFDEVLKEMGKHHEWQHLSPRERDALASTMKEHLGIKDDQASMEASTSKHPEGHSS